MSGSKFRTRLGTRKVKLAAWSAIILTLLACVFLPEVVSLLWHLTHGTSASFQQWQVPVPWGWRAFGTEQMLIVQRMHRFYYRPGAFSQVIIVPLVFPPDFKFNYEKWKALAIDKELRSGHQFVSERRILLSGQEGYCFSFSESQDPQRLSIRCDVPGHELSFGFAGDKTYAPTFDSIIQRVKRRGTPAPAR